jgi:hypothetical protein
MFRNWKIILFFVPWILLLLALLFWSMGFNPFGKKTGKTEVINTTMVLNKIENIGKLELVRYNFSEIYDYKALSEGKIAAASSTGLTDFSPDLKVVLIARGEAVGCIDLTKVKETDINFKKDTLFLALPAPEICYHKLDIDNTHIYDFERKGWWSRLFPNDEETKNTIEKAYQQAEYQILASAIKGGILDNTIANAQTILKPMLEEMSGRIVVLTIKPDNPLIAPEIKPVK